MGMFGTLMNSIFHHAGNAEAPPDAVKYGEVPQSRLQQAARQGGAPVSPAGTAAATPAATATPAAAVDVAAVLDRLAAAQHEKLDWKHSIVDMLKILGMDSSLAARKELAADLKYSGDTGDSAAMNIWLHKEVMKKLAENGGKVPAELLTH